MPLPSGRAPSEPFRDEFYTEYTPVPSVKIAEFDNDRLPFSRTFEFKLFISFVRLCVSVPDINKYAELYILRNSRIRANRNRRISVRGGVCAEERELHARIKSARCGKRKRVCRYACI